MNRFLFLFAILGFSGFLAYFSLFRTPERALGSAAVGVDISDGVRYVKSSTGSIDGQDLSFSGKTIPKEGYLRLSPISGVAYSGSPAPKLVEKSVSIGKGLYFFRLGDVFQDIAVEHADFRIKTLSRGNFYVDSRNPELLKIFSVSALLTIDLLDSKKTVTTAYVFPSTYFGYVPSYNTQLKDADILRVSTVNTIRYLDLETPEKDNPVFGNDTEASAFFQENIQFERFQAAEFKKAYETVFRLSDNVPSSDFAEEFGWYFLNKEKKSAILKGKLLRDLRNLAIGERCDDSKKCQNANLGISAIADTLAKMELVDPQLRTFGLAAIRQAYYLSYYEALGRSDTYFRSKTSNAFVSAVVRTTPGINVEYGDYAMLSEMHAAHYYGNTDASKLDEYLSAYVRSLLSGKVIRKTEFLPFSFFLKEYLGREDLPISRTTLDIAFFLVSVSNEYYATLASDDQRFSILTVLYYTYSKIADRIRKATAAEFLEQRDGGEYIKKEFVDEADNPSLPDGFVDSFDTLVKSFDSSYAKKQRELYASFLRKTSDKKISDTSTLLDKSLKGLRTQLSIFVDYGAYKQQLSLDEASRQASGIILEKELPDEEEIREYFSVFNGVEAPSLLVKNDYAKDGYYDIDVTINSRNFHFRFFWDNHVIENLTFENGGEKVDTFVHASVSLDEKKELYQKQVGMIKPEDPRYSFYVFENYFTNAYLSDRASFVALSQPDSEADTPTASSQTMDTETLIFVEQNLIQKDFRNIVDTFPINIANIDAKITDRTWNINLSGIRKNISGKGPTYALEFSGKYLFDQHAFYRMNVKLLDPTTLQPQLGGVSIQILPRSIPLKEIDKRTDELYDYVTQLVSLFASKTPSSAIISLTSGKLIVDGVEYDVAASQ
ncbi:MAG: hypothetical protein QG650_570 [Patescibacteria group bacterium]|nr:hypothetical protein [Patescibacteria group bacterium]